MNVSRVINFIILAGLLALTVGCAKSSQVDWKVSYGILSEEELSRPEVIQKLAPALKDRHESVRREAINHLKYFDGEIEHVVADVKINALTLRDIDRRRVALQTLIRLVGSDHEYSLYALRHSLSDQSRRNVNQRLRIVRMLRAEKLGPESLDLLEEISMIERHPNTKAELGKLIIGARHQ